jgi:hypothetical protein
MRRSLLTLLALSAVVVPLRGQDDPIKTLVGRLELEKYKATVKGLTQFGDRRQGTDRNRDAVNWIEAQLNSYGCPTGRIKYEYKAPPPNPGGRGRGNTGLAQGGGKPRGIASQPASTPIL